MTQSVVNFFKLVQILRERGNWKLIRRCRRQLLDFILCRNGLGRKPLLQIVPYWFSLLRGLDMLVWRLETFGFLFLKESGETDRQRLNDYL